MLTNALEKRLAECLVHATGQPASQVPGFAIAVAGYRERLMKAFEAELDALAAEAEKAGPEQAAAYYVCIDRIRAVVALVRAAV